VFLKEKLLLVASQKFYGKEPTLILKGPGLNDQT
jgi:hypothetical protein